MRASRRFGDVDLLNRVRGEYLEMPDMVLTVAQAGRLWGLDSPMSRRLLDELVEREFLRRAGDRYVRADIGPSRN
jgi:Fic family protein